MFTFDTIIARMIVPNNQYNQSGFLNKDQIFFGLNPNEVQEIYLVVKM